MIAVRPLTKMSIGILSLQFLSTNVAHFRPTPTGHLVTAITFDEWSRTLGTLSNLGFGQGFFDFESAFILALQLNYLLTPQRNMWFLSTLSTRFITAVIHRTLEDDQI